MTLNPYAFLDIFDELRSEPMITINDTWRNRSACTTLPIEAISEVFFPEDEDSDTIAVARGLCAGCPVFEQCQAWATENYASVTEGILFGFSALDRGLMHSGRLKFRDWRYEPDRITARKLAAREREALRRGEPAVVNVHLIYDMDDPEEKRAVIMAYREWQAAQDFPTSLDEAEARVTKLTNAWNGIGNTAAKSLPPELRPHCTNGHDPRFMYRERKTADGRQQWHCILMDCDYRVIIGAPVTQRPRKKRDTSHRQPCPNGHGTDPMFSRANTTGKKFWVCHLCKAQVPALELVGVA